MGGEAYGAHKTPPAKETLEDNLAMRFVGHFPTSSLAIREHEKKEWKLWADKASQLVYRPNLFHYSGGTTGLPSVAMQRTIEDFRFLAENSGVGFDVDLFPEYWSTQGPQLYLMAQLAYDPLQDGRAVLDDWYRRGFGKAATNIQAYFDLMEQAHYAILERIKLSSGAAKEATAVYQEVYSNELLDKAEALLEKSRAQVEGWQQSEDVPFDLAQKAEAEAKAMARHGERVAFIRTGFDFTRTMVDSMRAMAEVRESGGKDRAAVERAIALAEAREALFTQHDPMAFNPFRFEWLYEARQMQDYYGPPSGPFWEAAGLQ